jgi:(2Fe-2S) ferredoxin
MKQDDAFFDFHMMICTNERKLGEDCAGKGSKKLIEELKPWLKKELQRLGLEGKGRINQSGCLGRCGEGIACVAYPSGEWLTDVKLEDADSIKAWILARLKPNSQN